MPARGKIWKIVMMAGSFVLGIGLIVLLVAAMQSKQDKPCSDVKLHFVNAGKQRFTGYEVVMKLMSSQGIRGMKGRPVRQIDLKAMEERLEKHPWIENAELYIDNQRVLHAKIEEKTPIARIFTPRGASFYIDSNLHRIPLNERYSPRLPVFTGFPSDKASWRGKDSLLMVEVKSIAQYLNADSFWMAQVEQVDINIHGQFELWPKLGTHYILFGNGQDHKVKFHNLEVFYQRVLSRSGFNSYQMLDLRFEDQVVATRNLKKYQKTDSSLYRQWLKQWQLLQQKQDAAKQLSSQPPVKQEEVDHSSARSVPSPMKQNPSTQNPVPGKSKDTGNKGALPAEKTGPKAVMPPGQKTS
jgi:cell division protein FtsQ